MRTSIIVAFDKNRLIGKDGKLPWHLPEDLKAFKARTLNHPIIMGRVTWESIPKKPLKGRLNIVVSKTITSHELFQSVGYDSQLIYFQPNLESAIKLATWYCPNNDEIFVIGGQQIYTAALAGNLIDKIYATEVHGDYEGDVYFPPIPDDWSRTLLETRNQFDMVEYERRQKINS